MKNWQVYHFHDTSDSAKVKKTCNIADNLDLRPDASNLAAFLYLQKRKYPDTYSAIHPCSVSAAGIPRRTNGGGASGVRG
jgi:predicted ATPase